jgi:hypothetical protein
MKALRCIIIGWMLLGAGAAQSQFSMSFSFTPPAWGPAGYSTVRYYYLPDVEAYYDVRSSMFIYFGGGSWVRRSHLPDRYRDYDLYRGYKVVMPDYHGESPYVHFKEHKMKYSKGYRGKPQHPVGERPGGGNPGRNDSHGDQHGNQEKDHHNDRNGNAGHGNDKGGSHGNDKGHDNGKGNGNGKHK